jgi:hypothetical protein
MITEPELLNERLERLAMVLDEIMPNCALLVRDALELLKEQKETIDNLNETVRNLLQHIEDIGQYMTPIGLVEDVKAFVESRPQIVRCKDCKHWEQSNGHCPFNSIFTNDDWFCADGERKEGR